MVRRARYAHIALVLAACSTLPITTPATVAPFTSVSGAASATASAPASATAPGLAERPIAIFTGNRHWITMPNGLHNDPPAVVASFPGTDASPGLPRVRLRSTGRTVALESHPVTSANATVLPPQWTATVPVDGAPIGTNDIDLVVRVRGDDVVVGSWAFVLSMPEYVVWTLDFEGDAASNEAMNNTYDIAQAFRAPMTIMWNPRVWTTSDVTKERADTMMTWTQNIERAGYAEVALHVHAWTDFVRAAGVTPRTGPSWSGRSDGYDVPLTAFSEDETRRLIDRAVTLMTEHGFARPTSFRAGGLFANAANLRAIAAAGFTVDSSSTAAGAFGRLPLPWTLAVDAQPYRPSRDDANAAGDLPLLEVPNIAGNTYALTTSTIQATIRQDVAMLAPQGQPATTARALTLVSHPATIDATERAAIESLFRSLDPYRYDRDAGPLRFVTLRDLARAYGR